jgi:glyoxylase-like metal-dependent hydrolase (beta-lactamase superfamily II)
MASVEILINAMYMQVGLHQGRPILSLRWPQTPLPESDVYDVYQRRVFNLGTCNTVLVRSDKNVLIDPGIIQLSRYGALQARLNEVGLSTQQIDIVVNTHCHYDHVESNHLFRGKPLYIHEKEIEHAKKLYWPEYVKAFMETLQVQKVRDQLEVAKGLRIIETFGHTLGSISLTAETEKGRVVIAGDSINVKRDFLERRAPQVVTMNADPEAARRSIERIADLKPVLIIPGHDAPFTP